jgi:hypothetical protein
MGCESAGWIHLAQDRAQRRLVEHGNEPSVFLKSGGFFDQLSNYQFLKEDLFCEVTYCI